MGDFAIFPAPRDAEGYVALSRTRQGRLFRKHILNLGPLRHPKTGEMLNLDENWFARVKDNFNSGVCDIVQVPLANDKNEHSEDPLRNIGEVVDIARDGAKVYAMIDARDATAADKLGHTILGASAMLHMDYTDSRTGKQVGPTLLHVCATNRPYVTGLEDYSEVIEDAVAASADSSGEVLVFAAEEEPVVPTKEELIAGLLEHGIDVGALQAAAAQKQDAAAFTAAIVDALKSTGAVELSNTDDGTGLTQADLVGAVVELAQTSKTQAESITKLERREAEHEVDGYISAGRVLPKQRSAFVELALTNRDMLDTLLPTEAVVKLNHQSGITGPDGEQKQETDIDAEIMRLTAEHGRFFEKDQKK